MMRQEDKYKMFKLNKQNYFFQVHCYEYENLPTQIKKKVKSFFQFKTSNLENIFEEVLNSTKIQFFGILTMRNKVLAICKYFQLDQVLGRDILID